MLSVKKIHISGFEFFNTFVLENSLLLLERERERERERETHRCSSFFTYINRVYVHTKDFYSRKDAHKELFADYVICRIFIWYYIYFAVIYIMHIL